MRKHHSVTSQACPSCDTILNASTGLGHKRRPSPGDLTMCLYCAAILIFKDSDGATRLPSDEERVVIDSDQRIGLMRAAQSEIMKKIRQ